MKTISKEEMDKAGVKLTEELTDAGMVIEGGWRGYQLGVMPKDAGPVQVDETRKAFFAGANHLFSSIMAVLDPGREPTERDLERMSAIHDELQRFEKALRAEVKAKGH